MVPLAEQTFMSAPSHYENDAEFEADDENNGVKIAGSPNSTNMKLKFKSKTKQLLIVHMESI